MGGIAIVSSSVPPAFSSPVAVAPEVGRDDPAGCPCWWLWLPPTPAAACTAAPPRDGLTETLPIRLMLPAPAPPAIDCEGVAVVGGIAVSGRLPPPAALPRNAAPPPDFSEPCK